MKSESVIELGTKNYPFKSIYSATLDILVTHAGLEDTIIINLKAETSSYINTGNTIFINMHQVQFESYSDSTDDPEYATIIGTDMTELVTPIIKTSQFNIVKTSEAIGDLIISLGQLSEVQLSELFMQDMYSRISFQRW